MSITVKTPVLPDGIGQATVSKILVKPEQNVRRGQLLFDVETDTMTLAVEAPCHGIVKQILIGESDVVGAQMPAIELSESVDAMPTEDNALAPQPIVDKQPLVYLSVGAAIVIVAAIAASMLL